MKNSHRRFVDGWESRSREPASVRVTPGIEKLARHTAIGCGYLI